MNYEFSTKRYKSGKIKPKAKFDKEYEILDTFFTVDAYEFIDEMLHIFVEATISDAAEDEVLNETVFNVCGIKVKKNETYVYDALAEDGKGKNCTVSTLTLARILDEWKGFICG